MTVSLVLFTVYMFNFFNYNKNFRSCLLWYARHTKRISLHRWKFYPRFSFEHWKWIIVLYKHMLQLCASIVIIKIMIEAFGISAISIKWALIIFIFLFIHLTQLLADEIYKICNKTAVINTTIGAQTTWLNILCWRNAPIKQFWKF